MPPATDLYRSYLDLRWHFDPAAATLAGVPEANSRLGNFDAESMRQHLAAFRAMGSAVEEVEPPGVQEEIDRTAVLDDIRTTIFRFTHEGPHRRNPGFWLNHLYEGLYGLLIRADAPPDARARAALERLKAVPGFLRSAEDTLESPPPVFVRTAADMIAPGEKLIGEVMAYFAGDAGDQVDDLRTAAADAEAALARFGLALNTDLADDGDDMGFAVGEEQFNRRLHHEHALNATAPELWRYGLHLVEEVESELAALARLIDPDVHWRDVVDQLRAEAPAGEDIVDRYRAEMERCRAFTESRGLVTMPVGDLVVTPTPDYLRATTPFAAYVPPAPFSADRTGHFFVTSGRGSRCLYELAATAVHEAYPGHHLQIATSQVLPSEVRRVLWTAVTVEGWALYCEELMAEAGYYEDPAQRLFQRMHLLWRAHRILLDVALHTRGMSPNDAVEHLTRHLPMTQEEARAEVRRYCAMPSYQLCYAVGRREILQLREDYRARAGGPGVDRAFHDDLMQYGGLPVSLIRWGMEL